MSLLKRTAECAEACGTCSFQFLVIFSDISDIFMLYPYRAFTDPAGHRRPAGSCAFGNAEFYHFLFEIMKRSIAIPFGCWYNASRSSSCWYCFPKRYFLWRITMRYKKFLALLLALTLVCGSLSGCASERQTEPAEPTVSFTDSLGRTVDIPETLTRVAPSGAVASMFLATIAPEYMTTISATPSSSQYKYLDPRLIDLPTTGQMYGSKSTLNLESILTSGAQIVIDLGDKKDNMAADLDALQRQIGMPVIFIEADLPHMAEAYRTLGNILSGKEARGEELAAFVEETVSMAKENALKIQDAERISVLYTSGSSGLNTNAKGSIQAQVLDLMGIENAAVVEDVSNKGGGNPINLEQLYRFDPDVILFTAGSTYSTAADDEAWQPLRAIEAGRYYEIPSMPYNWLSNPPSLNMLLGVWWLGNLLYPQYYAYDMVEKTQEIFRLLWSYDLSADEARAMLANSTLKGTP